MKRGLVLLKYGSRAASTRYRFVQMVKYLEPLSITLEFCPLLDDRQLETLFATGKKSFFSVFSSYGKRLIDLIRSRNYDFIWVQYECFPYLPGIFETLVSYCNKPVIVDLDDAIFHQYDHHKNPLIRNVLGNKLAPLLRRSDLVICGNSYLQDYVSRYCHHTEIVPTTVDTTCYVPAREKPTTAIPVLGWIGSPSTWKYGAPLADVFSRFVKADQMSVLVVGAGSTVKQAAPFEFREWSEVREIADLQQMDIGVMPLPDEPWARGKCGFKLIQYMACGIPVIASPVGMNREIVEHGVNGYLATTPEEWQQAIERLLADAGLRKRMGEAGRTRVEKFYSIKVQGPRVAHMVQALFNQD